MITGRSLSKTAAIKKKKQQELINLEIKLKRLQTEHKATLDPNLNKEMQQLKTQINNIQSRDILKNVMFVKQKYYEVGGKSTKLLAYRLKKTTS